VATRSEPFKNWDMSYTTDYLPVWGVLNHDGELIVNFEYDSITIEAEAGIAACTKDGETVEINLAECEPIPRAEWKEYLY